MNLYDEFLVPDFDPTEYPTKEEYLELLKKAFDPHDTIIRNHKNVNKIARQMIAQGYSIDELYKLVDEARELNGLSKIERK